MGSIVKIRFGMSKKETVRKRELSQAFQCLRDRLAAVEEKYHLVVDQARVIVFQTDAAGQITSMNRAWTEITGFTEEDSLETAFSNYIHPDDRGCYQRYWSAVMRQQTDFRQEVRWITKNTGFRWMEVCQWGLRDAAGTVVGSMGIMNDVSDRRMTEDALEDSERRYRRYRQMFIDNPAVWLVVDPETGRIIDANAAAAKFYGYSMEELKTMAIFEINMLPVEEVRARMKSASNIHGKPFLFHHRLKSGETQEVEVYSGPFETGERTLLSSMVIDITAKRQAEAELQQSRDHLAMVIEGTQAGLWEWDIVNEKVYRDGRLQAICGYEAQDREYSLEEWAGNCHPDDLGRIKEKMAECTPGGAQTLDVEFRFRHKDGSYRWVRATGKSIFDQTGQPVRCMGSTVDINDRKRMEERQKENEFILRDFVRAVSEVSFIIDEDGRYLEVFGDAAEILPLPQGHLLGSTVFDVMPREQADELLTEIRLAMEEKVVQGVDYTVEMARGRRNIRRRVAPMSYTVDGKRTVAVVIQDITDQERARRVLETAYEMRRRSELINDLMNSARPLDESMLAYCRNLGLNFSRPVFSCMIACSAGNGPEAASREQRAKEEIIEMLDDIPESTVWTYRGRVGVFCQAMEYAAAGKPGGLRLAGRLRERVRDMGDDLVVAIGVSRAHTGPEALRKSAREARETVSASQCRATDGAGIFHYDDLGILQLLVDYGSRERAEDFIQGTIGRLIDYDRKNGTDYLTTLEVMLQSSSLKETANALFLHHNTAVYRKQRIEKLLGLSISSFEARLSLAAAIKLYRLKSTK